MAMYKSRQTFLETTEDMAWLRDVHVPLPPEYKFAVIFGNEDCPDAIVATEENRMDSHCVVYLRRNGFLRYYGTGQCEEQCARVEKILKG